MGGAEDPGQTSRVPKEGLRAGGDSSRGVHLSGISKEQQNVRTDWEQQMREQEVWQRTWRFGALEARQDGDATSEIGKPEGEAGLRES